MKKSDLVKYLDEYLNIGGIPDDSRNGLQIDNDRDDVRRVGVAVDAMAYTADLARDMGVDFLFVHHGMFWGHESVLTGAHYRRVRSFLDAGIALYGCHLPLDQHPESGNNIALLRALLSSLGLDPTREDIVPFGRYRGQTIGYGVRFSRAVSVDDFTGAILEIGIVPDLYNFEGKEKFSSVAVVTGGAGSQILEAHEEGYDVYITGEAVHYQITSAREVGQAFVLGGHYETETFGPLAVGEHLRQKFGLDVVSVDTSVSA